jgi:hypothetical protein
MSSVRFDRIAIIVSFPSIPGEVGDPTEEQRQKEISAKLEECRRVAEANKNEWFPTI